MPNVLIDGQPAPAAAAGSTWGDLLDQLDREVGPRGLIVTDVRFDGLDEPAFRTPAALAHPLAQFATVEVATGTPRDLMVRCVGDALAAIDPLCEGLRDIAHQLRGRRIQEASDNLVQALEAICTLLALGDAATRILVASDAAPLTAERIATLAAGLATPLQDLSSAQAARDWDRMADLLETRLVASLRAWAPYLDRLCQLDAA